VRYNLPASSASVAAWREPVTMEFMSGKLELRPLFSQGLLQASISALIWALAFWPKTTDGSTPNMVRAKRNLPNRERMRMSGNLLNQT